MEKDNDVKESSDTDTERAQTEEYRSFVEEPGDDDGENRHPQKRTSILATALLETKAMVGSGLLNVPYTFKTLGIFASIAASLVYNLVTFLSVYFLLRCKDITQHYSYSVYSKLSMGWVGTISCKLAILIRSISLCCVLLKILGNIIRTLLGIYAITYLFASLVILFIYKYIHNEILPKEERMLYPNGTFFNMFKCFGSYLNAYLFQVNVFPIYLPLHPRTTRNMLISTSIGTILSSIIYISFGIIGFAIYRYNIEGTLLEYIGDDLIAYLKTSIPMAALLIVFEIAFIINTTISTALNFFVAKSQMVAIAKLLFKKVQRKKTDESMSGTPLVSLDESGYSTEKIGRKNSEETILNNTSQNIISFLTYLITIAIGYYSDNIITIDNFNGSTVNNYLSVMLPPLFFVILARQFKLYFEKFVAILLILFSLCLITGYFLVNFTSIFA